MRAIIFFLIAAGIFAFNIFDNTYAPYVADAAFFVITITGIAEAAVLRHGLRVEIKEGSPAVKGQKYLIRFTVKNNTCFPLLWGKAVILVRTMGNGKKLLKKPLRAKIPFSCPPKKNSLLEYEMESAHCETVTVTLKKYYVWDFIHLFGLGRKSGDRCDIVVMPDTMGEHIAGKLSSELSMSDDGIYSTVKSGSEPTDITGIREYSGGDRINSIHWKLSSKAGELMVKQYGLPLKDRDYVIVDIFEGKCGTDGRVKLYDKLYELLYAFICALTARGYGFNAVYYNGRYNRERVETQNDIVDFFADLYRITPYDGEMSAARMFAAYNREKIERRIYYVTPYYNDEAVGNMNLLSETGTVYYLIPGHTGETALPVKYNGQRGTIDEQ